MAAVVFAIAPEVELGFGGVEAAAYKPEVVGIVELLAVDKGSIADKDHIPGIAGSIVDIVVAVDTTVLLRAQYPVRQTGAVQFGWPADWDLVQAMWMLRFEKPGLEWQYFLSDHQQELSLWLWHPEQHQIELEFAHPVIESTS